MHYTPRRKKLSPIEEPSGLRRAGLWNDPDGGLPEGSLLTGGIQNGELAEVFAKIQLPERNRELYGNCFGLCVQTVTHNEPGQLHRIFTLA
jgi:hypothetical protein